MQKKDFLKEKIQQFLAQTKDLSAEQITEGKQVLLDEIKNSTLLHREDKKDLEALFKPLRNILEEKKEKALMSMSQDERETLQQLKEALQSRINQRQEIKVQLDSYRKEGSSCSDFVRAMELKELLQKEKEQLQGVETRILELQKKITQLEMKLSA